MSSLKYLSLYSLVFFLLAPRDATACQTVKEILKKEHYRFFMYIRRGIPGSIVSTFYKAINLDIVNLVKDIAPKKHSMGTVCISSEQLDKLKERHTLDEEVAAIYKLDPFMFFLPQENKIPALSKTLISLAVSNKNRKKRSGITFYSDDQLALRSPMKKKRVEKIWLRIEEELKRPAKDVRIAKISILPGGLFFFYDPAKSGTCAAMRKLVPNTAEELNAETVTTEVIAMVIRLKLLGVSDTLSLHILKHHVAFTFTLLRCMRRNNANLPISRAFFPIYKIMSKKFSEGKDRNSVPEIPAKVIQTRLSSQIKILSHYQSWGKLRFLSFRKGKIFREDIKDRIFDPAVLQLIREDIAISVLDPIMKKNAHHPKRKPVAVRDGDDDGCDEGYDPLYGKCCPELCRNADILDIPDFDPYTCCEACSQDNCVVEHELINRLTTVPMDPFGLSPEMYVTIML